MKTLESDPRSLVNASPVEVLLISIAVLRLLEVPWYGSLVCVLLLSGLTLFGRVVNARLFNADVSLGTSFVVGCGVFVLLGQTLIGIGIGYRIAHWLSFAIIVGAAVIISSSSTTKTADTNDRVSSRTFAALSIGLVALSIYHLWLAPFAVAVALRSLLDGRSRMHLARWVAASGVVLGWLASFGLRPEKWWYFYQGNDAQYFEAIGWSIARWGVFEHPGYVGYSIANYHWFTYAFFGSLGEIASLGPWVALINIGPLLIAVLLASLFVPRVSVSIQWFAAVLAVLASGITRADSLVFSFVVVYAIVELVKRTANMRLRASHYGLFILLSVVIMLTKVSTAAMVFALLLVMSLLQKRRAEASSFPVAICFVVGFSAVYLFLLRNNDSGLLTEGYGLNVARSFGELQDLLEPGITLNYLLWVILIPVVLAGRRAWRDLTSLDYSAVVVASAACAAHLFVAGRNSRYFVLAGIAILTFIVLVQFNGEVARRHVQLSGWSQKLLRPLIVVSVFAGYASADVLRRARTALDLDGMAEIWLRDTLIAGGLCLMLLLAMLLFVASRRARLTASVGVALVSSVFVGQSAELFRQTLRLGPGAYTSSNVATAVFGTNELVALGDYVRSHTSVDTILASNQFCDVGEIRYFPHHVENEFRLQSVVIPAGECKWRTPYFLLPVYSQRRFLAQGSLFQIGMAVESGQLRRLVSSIAFANRPSPSNFEELKSLDVSGFIVNLSLTNQRDWSKFAVERFRIGEFVYLELK